ncbi:MAG TPA: energy-coupling factor transporter transmembrane component T [Anaerolineales bacterium]|jgi:energy-coupling factor transporter transmembrane protein EcfT|nr:energy-coupling factor transporter transmembrane component T [Anaerolineales bacterium]
MAIEYQKGDSFLHRLDARTKLLLFVGMTVLAIVIADPILMGLLFAALYFTGRRALNPKLLNANLRILIVIFLTFALFQIIFFETENAHFLFYLIPFRNWIPVTVEGLIRGLAVFFRFFSVVLSVHLMLYTTPPVDLALTITKREQTRSLNAMLTSTVLLGIILFVVFHLMKADQIQALPFELLPRTLIVLFGSFVAAYLIQRVLGQGLPPEMGMALTLGFATVGLLSKQTEIITDAQKARGYDVKPKNLIRRLQVFAALLLPIFLATLERSQDISVAILSRGFDYNINARTYRRQLKFQTRDYIVLSILVLLLFGSLYLNYLQLGNPTEQLVLRLLDR